MSRGEKYLAFAKFLVLGLILLLFPITVVVTQDSACAGSQTYCFGGNINKTADSFLPYVMLSGGLFIAYGMKKIADSRRVEAEDEAEHDEQS